MHSHLQRRKSDRGPRWTAEFRLPNFPRAFTLIELMVVIGIIALLLTTSLFVMGNILQSAREKATLATITKLDGMMQQRAEAMQRYLEKSTNLAAEKEQTRQFLIRAYQAYGSYPPVPPWTIDNASERTWDTMTRARKMREIMPQSFVDICGPDRYPGTAANDDGAGATNWLTNGAPDINELGVGTNHGDALAFVKVLQNLKAQLDLSKHRPETESAELLYIALTAAEAFGVPPVGQDEFSTSEIKDTDGDGLVEFVDAWGNPLRFYRAPTRLFRCGEDAFTGDTNGNMAPDSAGPTAAPNPLYASLMMQSLPSTKAGDKPLYRDANDAYGSIERYIIRAPDTAGNTPSAALQNDRRRFFEFWFYTPETYYTMLIVSAGTDGNLGLYEPGDTPSSAPTASSKMGHLGQPATLGDPTASPLVDNVTNRKK